ncbi:hypothetical protein [Geothrix sp. 21YS21S-2]|uniref:hypothetical protein n=1 Tax=Geothrix sp. 21YS21S-2 TaxID=3068893 RepID=UPI0027B9B247|nr:hypothetical protein [Geothrix sp. 21YS21S-2]
MTRTPKHLTLSASALVQVWHEADGNSTKAIARLGTLNHGAWTAVRPVLDELEKIDDEAAKAIKDSFPDGFGIPSESVQAKLVEILSAFPELVDPDDSSPQSDLFVIADAADSGHSPLFSRRHLRSKLLPRAFQDCINQFHIQPKTLEDLKEHP